MSLNVGTVSAFATLNAKGFVDGIKTMHREGVKNVGLFEARLNKAGDAMTSFGRKATMRMTLPLVAGLTAGVREAANLEGALAKFDVVFRGLNEEMNEWVDTFRNDFPLARTEIVKSAAAMQDLLVPMGVNRKLASEMTREWMELAGALSAFNDVPIEQALDAIQSGIAGQSRPLRQFGIDVRETVLQQTALENGLIRAGQAMSEQVRQQALLIQATKQSSDAIEGLEEQKGSLLWVMQGLKADVRDFAGALGKDLLPIVTELAIQARGLMQSFLELDESQRKNILRATLLVAVLGPVAGGLAWALKITIPLVGYLTGAIKGLTTAMMKNPATAIAVGITGVGVAAWNTAKNVIELKNSVDELVEAGEDADLQSLIDAAVKVGKEIEKIDRRMRGGGRGGMTNPTDEKNLERLNEEYSALLVQIASIRTILRDTEVPDDVIDSVEDTTDSVDDLSRALMGLRPRIENAFAPIDEVIDIMPIRKEIDHIAEVMGKDWIDGFDKLFPAHSLGDLQMRLSILREELLSATDPTTVRELKGAIAELEMSIDGTTKGMQIATMIADDFTRSFGAGMANVVVQGDKLVDTLKNIGKLLMSSAIQKGISLLLSGGLSGDGFFGSGGGLFGRIFGRGGQTSHTGGLVQGVGNQMVTAQGGQYILSSAQVAGLTQMGGTSKNVSVNIRVPLSIGDREVWEANRRYEVNV